MGSAAEIIQHRYIAAVEFSDHVTGLPVTTGLTIDAPGLAAFRNRSGRLVLKSLPGFDAYCRAFETLPVVAAAQVDVAVTDAEERFLPRTFRLDLPRDPHPDHAGQADSLFAPARVTLYRAPAAGTGANWSVIRASVTTGGKPAMGALLRVVRKSDDTLMARGLTDRRGEGLVAVPGVPVTTFSTEAGGGDGDDPDDEPIMALEVPVRIEAFLDAAAGWPVNPDRLDAERATLNHGSQDTDLATGREVAVRIAL